MFSASHHAAKSVPTMLSRPIFSKQTPSSRGNVNTQNKRLQSRIDLDRIERFLLPCDFFSFGASISGNRLYKRYNMAEKKRKEWP
jgi:hypothetical protein